MTVTSPLNLQESNLPSSTEPTVVVTPEFAEPAPPAPAPPAPAPEKLTPKQIGQLRRQYVTIVNGTVKSCGHKDNFSKNAQREGKIPSNNCIGCWEAYFMTSVDLDLVHAVLTTKGASALIAMKGTKFVKMFHGFLSSKMLPMLAAETDKAKLDEPMAQIVGGTFGGETTTRDVEIAGVSDLSNGEGSMQQST